MSVRQQVQLNRPFQRCETSSQTPCLDCTIVAATIKIPVLVCQSRKNSHRLQKLAMSVRQ